MGSQHVLVLCTQPSICVSAAFLYHRLSALPSVRLIRPASSSKPQHGGRRQRVLSAPPATSLSSRVSFTSWPATYPNRHFQSHDICQHTVRSDIFRFIETFAKSLGCPRRHISTET